MNARQEVLSRIRRALSDVPAEERPGGEYAERSYLTHTGANRRDLVDLFAERAGEYRATVNRITGEGDLQQAISEAVRRHGLRSLAAPQDFPRGWLPEDVEVVLDDPRSPLPAPRLAGTQGVLTGCALAIAQTGTIALDSGARQGRRALSLLPDHHLCVVFASEVVGTVPEAVERLSGSAAAGSPITLISGPSATSDIELERVEGVHGPRHLEILLVEET